MRIAIMGSGGVGGYFGARLVQGGADVHFIARGAHLAAMRERGLTIEGGPNPIHLPNVNVSDDPKTIGPVDVVMFCVKLWDTEAAARQLLPLMQPATAVISFQNGVQKDDMLRPIVGEEALVGGVAYVGTAIGQPGVIVQTGSIERLVFGEYNGRRSARVEAFYAACRRGEWYVTGDRGRRDADGYLWFVSRADDVIISAGYRIGPFEVESALLEHPAVVESAVVASPDPVRGELVKAFVVLRPGHLPGDALVRELQEHVKRVTAPYKYPREIEFVDDLPKTVSGKIRRVDLRAREQAKKSR